MLFAAAAGFALVVAQREQEHFAGDELIAAFLRFLVGQVEQIAQVAADLHIAAVPFLQGLQNIQINTGVQAMSPSGMTLRGKLTALTFATIGALIILFAVLLIGGKQRMMDDRQNKVRNLVEGCTWHCRPFRGRSAEADG
jgi:hypothetical protein